MSLTQGAPLPSIETTKDVVTKGPDWYNTYLEDLAKSGTSLISQPAENLVAGFAPLQQQAIGQAPAALTGYQPILAGAGETAQKAAQGMTPEMIQSFMNPYTSGVVNEMERLQQQNLQRNLLPTLRGAFTGTGGFGGQRMAQALGQMSADFQANLTGQQAGALQKGYESALRAAADQSGLYRQAAETERGLAATDLDLALKSLERQFDLGSEEQKLEQAKILAPVTAATGAANIFSNLKVPTTVSEKAFGPIPGAYSTSPLAQIAGLGSLFASGAGGTSAAQGVLNMFGDFMKMVNTPSGGAPATYGTSEGE